MHVDNGILAMTLAMTRKEDYTGGGTFFEHMGANEIVEMDVGHGTFRPGSVRHGGHKVTSGVRYILGAFLLIEDKPEHVRRLKNRGSEIRKAGDLDNAAKYFEWIGYQSTVHHLPQGLGGNLIDPKEVRGS